MTVVEKIIGINNVFKEIFEFVQKDELIKPDFEEYLSTIGAMNATAVQMEKLFIPYIFERYLGENNKSVLEHFLERGETKEKKVAESFLDSQYTIFKIKRVLKNSFKLYNMTNEKEYEVISLAKMTNFRGIGVGEFIVARIFKMDGEYYLIGIDNVLKESQADDANRYAVVKIVQTPWLVYDDNKEKEEEIKSYNAELYDKFIEVYGADEVVSTNKYADDIIGQLSEDEAKEDFDKDDYIKPIEEYKFYEIKELNNEYSNFLENSMGGFSSHSETYDVGIVIDKELGLYTIPFYQTFNMIFEDKSKVENAKECVEFILKNDSVPVRILDKISARYKNFMKVINELLGTNYTYDELLEKYKYEFLKRKIYSSTSVLFHSSVFATSLGLLDTVDEFVESNM